MAREPIWYREAKKYIGVREGRGAANNPQVIEFYKLAHHDWVKEDAVPWCAAFEGAMLETTGYRSTRMLTARSYLNWGQKLTTPRLGCIVVLKRGNSTWQGHVGFYAGDAGRGRIKILGGNQADAVNIRSYPKSKVLGYRWPKTLGESRTVRNGGVAEASMFGIAGLEGAQQMMDLGAQASQYVDWAKYIVVAIAIFAVGRMVWAYLDDRKNKRLA